MIISFQITKWEKYNPRNDRNNYSWFRFENSFFTDPEIFSLEPNAKFLLTFLFCEASKNGNGEGKLNIKMASALTGLTERGIKEHLQAIENTGVATIDNQKTPLTGNGTATNERTNERTTSKTEVFDFESVYLNYPRKVGKAQGIKKCRSKIKTPEQYKKLCKAVDNYSQMCQSSQTEKKYIKHFSTFMNCWEDFLELEIPGDPLLEFMKENEEKMGEGKDESDH